jgi:hypothetical protein
MFMNSHPFRTFATTLTTALLLVGCVKPPSTPAPSARTTTNKSTVAPAKVGSQVAKIGTDVKAKASLGVTAKTGTADAQTLSHARSGASRALNIISLMGDASLKAANQAQGRPALASAALTQPKNVRYVLYAVSGSGSGSGDAEVNGKTAIVMSPGATSAATVDTNASGTVTTTLVNADAKGDVSNNGTVTIVEKAGGEKVITANGNVADDIKVSDQQSNNKDDGKVELSQTIDINTDENNGTGKEVVKVTKDTSGKALSTEIDFSADDNAKANGEGDEQISVTPNNDTGSDNNLDIKLAIDPNATGPDNQAEATVEERQDDNGDITTEGDLVLPGDRPVCATAATDAASCPAPKTVHITIVIHADGTKDITCVGADYSFAVAGVSKDGAGHGTLFMADDISDTGTKIGEITLNKGAAEDEIRFYQADGTLGDSVKFKFSA